MQRTLALAGLILLLAAGSVYGQAQRGSISVTVTNAADGTPLPGVTVEASSTETLTSRTVVTDADGEAQLVALDPAQNYVVTADLEGFNGARFEQVLVRAGQNTPLAAQLQQLSITEEVVVTGETPVVDTTSAAAGQEITLQLTESIPTGRSYQDYLQLVPGVQDTIDDDGNPASRSGVNYRDVLGEVGRSTDNFYYFDGIDVTDHNSGTFGANMNTEIIQEQSVLTGGIPAEFVGAPGLISNVVTKSGGNQFSGSVNYYFQDDGLVEDNENFADESFSTFDTAATLGGPIAQDRAWFFASFRIDNREDDVVSPDTDALLRTVENESEQAFGKVTWAITDQDLFSGVFLSDPTDITGQDDNTLSNARDFAQEQGGERWLANYSRVWGIASLELGVTDHESDLNVISAIQETQNDVAFRLNDSRTQAEEQRGGAGDNDAESRGTEAQRGSLELLLDSDWGDHTVKFGAEFSENFVFEDEQFVDDARWVSLSDRYLNQNVTMGEIDGGGFSQETFVSTNVDNFNGLIDELQRLGLFGQVAAVWDTNNDGVISAEEMAANAVFNDTAGNPHGQINYSRDLQTTSGPRELTSEGTAAYLQDTWQWNKWAINAGVRGERWEHFASTGDRIVDFDWEYAPRVSIAYDVQGDGTKRISAYYGRYYDPIRNNMTQFAGSLTGRVVEEQVWVDPIQQFVTFRTRGGPQQQDGFFANNIETPYTDEIQLGYKQDLGRNMSIEANLIRRETDDIMEDYTPFLYTQADSYPGPIDDPDSLFLGPDFFGFPGGQPDANFFISTLFGAERDWDGVELIFRKRYSNNWQMLASYNYADAEGNSISDSNADFAGDVLWWDPRAPNVEATLPGLVEHLFKVAGSYNWDNGVQVGAKYRWNSGVIANISGGQAFSRNFPQRVDVPFEFAGINNQLWFREGSVGGLDNPDYGILDLRLAYIWDLPNRLEADFFLDVINALDDQEAQRVQDLVGGGQGFGFQQGIVFTDPRRYVLGARLRF